MLKVPSHFKLFISYKEEWVEIADLFERKWKFGRSCMGAIDEKNVMMQAPSRPGSERWNER